MRIGDRTGRTDAGRKRRQNEDSFVVEPPLFAVADGMGGAQAGEVASRLAAAAFREFHDADTLAPEQRVEAIIQEANRRIFDRARTDAAASGMGTTVTAALVGDDHVTIGHVGDSRAYRIRDGALEQLTQDHSLVADLMRSGRLTPEEADTHPQRSVITRALGTDREVDVDTFSVEMAPGDVFLLCSDGLTTMVGDDEILRLVRESSGLDSAGKALVKAANRHGGDDNVTVVLFTVEDGAALEETAPIATNGHGDADDLEDTLTGLEAPTAATPVAPAAAPDDATTTAVRPPVADERGPAAAEPERPSLARRVALALLVLLVLAVLVAAAFFFLGSVTA